MNTSDTGTYNALGKVPDTRPSSEHSTAITTQEVAAGSISVLQGRKEFTDKRRDVQLEVTRPAQAAEAEAEPSFKASDQSCMRGFGQG